MSLSGWLTMFAHPTALAGLVVVPLVAGLAVHARRRRRRLLERLGPAFAVAGLLENPRRVWPAFVFGLALALLAIGAASPRWGRGEPPAVAPGRDVVVVVDVSRSMSATDVLPSRLGRAKSAAAELADAVQARGGHRLALVAVAAGGAIVCPLTHDTEAFRRKLAALDAAAPPPAARTSGTSGTRLGAGLSTAVSLLDPVHRGAQDVILLTDGDDPAGDEEWRDGAAAARAAGVPVHVVGIGDPDHDSPVPNADGDRLRFRGAEVRSRLHEEPLREIARRTNGTYLPARTQPPQLAEFFRETVASGPTRESIAGTLPEPPSRRAWFFVAALLALTVAGTPTAIWLKAWAAVTSRRRIAAASFLVLASAAPMPDVEVRRGTVALDAGRPEDALAHFARAAERTTDPGLVAFNQGIALARLDRYREAELHFRRSLSDAEGDRRARALYNLGACLLHQSRGRQVRLLRQSVECFELARAAAPDDLRDDLLHNLELAKRLLAVARDAAPPSADPGADDPDESPLRPGGTGPEGPAASGRDVAKGPPNAAAPARSDRPETAKATDRPPAPGKGNLPPIPDDDVLAAMTPEDARAHLDRAEVRIVAARAARLKQTAPAPSQQFPDW